MERYFVELQQKVDKYLKKYPDSPRWVAVKLIWWNFMAVLPRMNWRQFIYKKNKDKGVLMIAFRLGGGVGDIVIAGNYIKELYKFTKGVCRFHIFVSQDLETIKSALNGNPHISVIAPQSDIEIPGFNDDFFYDAIFQLSRYPHVEYFNNRRIKELSPDLLDVIQELKRFCGAFTKYHPNSASLDTLTVIYSLLQGQNRRSQPDIGGLLKMTNDVKPCMTLEPARFGIMEQFGLECNCYITFQRGVNIHDPQNNVRNWPLNYYRELIQKIKAKYPDLKIVMLGRGSGESSCIDAADVNLCGKTDFEDVKVILKYSRLHIDGECGLVHVKSALNGKSAVFFGQTRVDFCGYPQNINMTADACPMWCEWLTDDWMTRCARGFSEPLCMTKMTPDIAFEYIVPELDKQEVPASWRQCEEPRCEKYSRVVLIGQYDLIRCWDFVKKGSHVCIYNLHITASEISRSAEAGCELEFGDIYNINEKDNSCDLVIWNLAEGFIDYKYALIEIKRILAPEGILEVNNMTSSKLPLDEFEVNVDGVKVMYAEDHGKIFFIKKQNIYRK